jgi:hypothetical protein
MTSLRVRDRRQVDGTFTVLAIYIRRGFGIFGRDAAFGMSRFCLISSSAPLIATAAVAATPPAIAASAAAAILMIVGFPVVLVVMFRRFGFRPQQRLTIRYRNLVIVGMDFAKGQEAVAIASIFDEGGLQRWLDPRYAGEIDISAKLFLILGLEIEFFNPIAASHNDTRFLRVGGVYQHFVEHYIVSSRRRGNQTQALPSAAPPSPSLASRMMMFPLAAARTPRADRSRDASRKPVSVLRGLSVSCGSLADLIELRFGNPNQLKCSN